MRYLAILLLAPWLLILCWAYWAYPRNLPRTSGRRIFDFVALLLALIAAVQGTLFGFETALLPTVDQFGGRTSGLIWQQVLPALYGYGAFAVMLGVALLTRHGIFHRFRHRQLSVDRRIPSRAIAGNHPPTVTTDEADPAILHTRASTKPRSG